MNDPTGYECDCAACGLRFTGEAEFDAHRIGRYGTPSRRCLTPAELREARIEFLPVPREATARPTAKANPCPHWEDCIATHCPVAGGTHLRNEPVCRLLLAHARGQVLPDAVSATIVVAVPAVRKQYPDIARKMDRAAATQPRCSNLSQPAAAA